MDWILFTKVLANIGGGCVAIAAVPLAYQVFKQRNTTLIPTMMYTILCFACYFYATAFSIQAGMGELDAATAASVIIPNALSGLIATTLLTIQKIVRYKARKEGLTEAEFCAKHQKGKK